MPEVETRGEQRLDVRIVTLELARYEQAVEQARHALDNARARLDAAMRERVTDLSVLRDLEMQVAAAQQAVKQATAERFTFQAAVRTALNREITELRRFINEAEARIDELLGLVKIVGW